MNRVALGLAVGAGYLLGRTKKAKLALAVGSMVAGKKLNLGPRGIAELVNRQMVNNPQFKEIGDQLREELRGVGKAASGAMVERQMNALADRLHGRTAQVRDELAGVVPPPGGEEAEGEDEYQDEDEYEYEDWEGREAGEESEPASADESGRNPAGEAADRGEPARKEAARKRPPARKAPAKNAPGQKTAEKVSAGTRTKKAAKKAPAKKAAAKTAAGQQTCRYCGEPTSPGKAAPRLPGRHGQRGWPK
ncbi:PE-PGRS family protein, partial [Streptomyces sp. NPDC056159]|uniref:PE-PGRS family protein n=1 Tax=Streptomyces sp. NPDC056159 TaxID=3155537 RepID=UPI00341475C9